MDNFRNRLSILDQPIPEKDTTVSNAILNSVQLLLIECSQISGFTLTFKKKYHEDDDLELHRYVEQYLLKSKCWNKTQYVLFSEYTSKGNIHYHGVMFNQYQINVMKCIKSWRRKFGFVKVELEIRNVRNWYDYITKNYGKIGLWTLYKFK